MTPDLLRRQVATEATMARYRRKKFDFAKRATCVHMVQFHLRQMGRKVPTVPDIRSFLGARRALAAHGWGDVGAMMDSLLEPVAPAAMLLGDVAMLRSEDDSGVEDGLGSLVVCVGHKVIGWHPDAERMVVIEPLEIARAWRV